MPTAVGVLAELQYSAPRPPEPRPFYLEPLPASRYSRGSRRCHPHCRCHSRTLADTSRVWPGSTGVARADAQLQIVGVRIILWVLSFVVNMDHAQWDDSVANGLHFLEHSVLQVPLFLMTFMRYLTPTLDDMYDQYPPNCRLC